MNSLVFYSVPSRDIVERLKYYEICSQLIWRIRVSLFDATKILMLISLTRVTNAKVNEYYEKIEAVVSRIVAQVVSHLN